MGCGLLTMKYRRQSSKTAAKTHANTGATRPGQGAAALFPSSHKLQSGDGQTAPAPTPTSRPTDCQPPIPVHSFQSIRPKTQSLHQGLKHAQAYLGERRSQQKQRQQLGQMRRAKQRTLTVSMSRGRGSSPQLMALARPTWHRRPVGWECRP